MNALTKTKAESKSVIAQMAERYQMDPRKFEEVVRATCSPKGKEAKALEPAEFAAFLLVAREYNLNPLTKEIYAFPAKGGGIVPIVSVDGWASLVNSHKACDGFKFQDEHDSKGNLVSCTCIMYRSDRTHPVEITEYLAECIRNTDPWKMKHRMLRHKTLIQAARYAFGFSGIYDEDEGDKIANMKDVTPVPTTAAVAPSSSVTTAPTPPPISEQTTVAAVPQSAPHGDIRQDPITPPSPNKAPAAVDPLRVPAPQTGKVPEVDIPANLDRREKKDPDPGAIADADVVSETPRQPAATAHDELLDELASKLSPGMPYDEVGELQDEYESMLDGAPDAVFAKFNSIIAEAKQNAGF